MMRIVHVTPTYWPAIRYGGPIRSVRGLCAGLASLGHDVHVMTTNVDGPGLSDVAVDVPICLDGCTVRYFRTGVGRRIYRSPAMGRALKESVVGADIVHIHAVYLWPGWAAARAAERAGVPYIVSPRGMLEPGLIMRRSRLAKEAWIELIERRTLSRAAAIHVTSEIEAVGIRLLGLDVAPMIEVPNGVELPREPCLPSTADEEAAWPGTQQGRRLLYLGRLSWKKGLKELLNALALVPDVELTIAGNDEENLLPRLRAQAQKLGVHSRVRFTGGVEGAEKLALLSGADLLVLPSLNENFGIVVLEALAMGTPVIVTRGVGAAEIVARYGLGAVVEGDSDSLGAAIGGLLADPARRCAIGLRGQQIVRQRYGWCTIANQMDELYRSNSINRAEVSAL